MDRSTVISSVQAIIDAGDLAAATLVFSPADEVELVPTPAPPPPAPVGVTDLKGRYDKASKKAVLTYTYDRTKNPYVVLRDDVLIQNYEDNNGDANVPHTGTRRYRVRDKAGVLSNEVTVSVTGVVPGEVPPVTPPIPQPEPTPGGVLRVGSDGDVKTLAEMKAKLKDGLTVLFRQGETFATAGTIEIRQKNVRFLTYGTDTQRPVLRYDGGGQYNPLFMLRSAKAVEFVGFTLETTGIHPAFEFTDGAGGHFHHLHSEKGKLGHFMQIKNGAGILVEYCENLGVQRYDIFVDKVRGLIVRKNVFLSSVHADENEHKVRMYNAEDVEISDNRMEEGRKSCVNFRDGERVKILRNDFTGPSGMTVGALMDDDGSPTADLGTDDTLIESNTFRNGGIDVELGAKNTRIHSNVFHPKKPGQAFIKFDYQERFKGRGPASGEVIGNIVHGGGKLYSLTKGGTVKDFTMADNESVA